jgi:hypothetical protein
VPSVEHRSIEHRVIVGGVVRYRDYPTAASTGWAERAISLAAASLEAALGVGAHDLAA